MNQLTKTDFIQYLNCPKSLWLLKNKPEDYKKREFSLFLEKLIKEGYEVEEYAQKLFLNAVSLPDFGSAENTKHELKTDAKTFFQATFETSDGAFARIDILEKKDDGTFHIYEIKSSTSIKKDKKHNHLKDACFQKHVMLENGYNVSAVSIIHLNKDYVRDGEINPKELLKIVDVTNDINEIYDSVTKYISDALTFINKSEISLKTCSCRENTRSNHCDSFAYFNPDIDEYNIYEIGRISKKRIVELIDMDIFKIKDIPSDYELNDQQKLQIESVKQESPIVNVKNIEKQLSSLEFPLYFIDYETYASAVPKIDGIGPHKHVVFQVSIHKMHEDGKIEHYEYLADKLELPKNILEYMKPVTEEIGTYISWHASFEKSRNKDMVKMIPEFTEYLENMNNHMFDLEDIFKIDYVDYRFHGSTSIKKVLPVIVPELSYSDMNIKDGTMALDAWGRMVMDPNFDEDPDEMRKNLLKYCELDTLAMVELYKTLLKKLKN